MWTKLIKIRQNLLLTFVLAQIGWFACVLGAAPAHHGISEVFGMALALLITLWHVTLSPRPLPELQLVLWAGGIGLVGETLLAHTGFFIYQGTQLYSGGTTWWLLVMWLLFGSFINTLLAFLKERYVLAFLLGAVGGPLAYISGSQFGGLGFTNTLYAGCAIGVLWAIAMPILIKLSNVYDGSKFLWK